MTKKTTAKKTIPVTRQAMRDQLLGHAPKPNRKEVTLFGVVLEMQQPTLGSILKSQDIEDGKERAVNMIIQYSFVPGTNDPIFEEADKDIILNWPFNDELVTLQLTIAELTGVDVKEAEAELKGNPSKEQS